MKIYRRKEFMNLPEGTIYCKGKPWYWEQLSVKAESINDNSDFIEMQLNTIESDDSGDLTEKYERMLELGESYPLTDDYYGRDGCFDEEDLFLVYEQHDLQILKSIIEKATIN